MKSILVFLAFLFLPHVSYAQCGNGVLEPEEFCDDGNNADDDLCSANCMFGAPVEPTHKLVRPLRAFSLTLISSYFTLGFAPSIGHLYAGESERAIKSWKLRMAAYGIVAAGTVLSAVDFFRGPTDEFDDRNFCEFGLVGDCLGVGLVGGGFVVAASTLGFDLMDAPVTAWKARQLGRAPWRQQTQISFSPSPDGASLGLQLKF